MGCLYTVVQSLVQSYEQETEKESVEFFCNDCDYRTDKKANWYKHRKKHLGTSQFSWMLVGCV